MTVIELPTIIPPLVTATLPGIGGRIRERDEDFAVDEIAAYEPSGEGEHVWAWIEKRDLTTPTAAARLAERAGVSARDVGWAGMKDRHALTRQWLSLPPPTRPESIEGLDEGGLRVLRVTRHKNKLKTGHLHGNRFALVVRGLADPVAAAARARDILAALAAGSPNWYAEQRFGRDGDNAERGLALVRARGKGPGAPRERRFMVSALQSYFFNHWLAERIKDGLLADVLVGDLLQKRGSGGMFASTDPDVDRPRVAAGEIVPTGPMFGAAMRGPPDGSPAHAREAAILDAFSLGPADFQPLRAIAEGTRRHATIIPGAPAVEVATDAGDATGAGDAIRVTFSLPAGAYATAVMREIQKLGETESAPWT
ncbi:MAG TPA: tRNA pseudouridine(13) synthase TruD [Kofleriaceae bacterium]|nr:tRNA pseudouridine(13) synthase TruD [Kofleriaceae bacterium]